jgi:hypothetical protein
MTKGSLRAGEGGGGMKCQWEPWIPDDFNTWDTSCGEAHCFIESGIKDNKYKFCPYCGLEIEEVRV